MIGVVIPYFQRAPGLLTRALRSVADQDCGPMRIYIVDDGSPLSPDGELARLPRDYPHELKVLRQANAGPAGARNLALEALDSDVKAVAFLDSDDRWNPHHMANACAALNAGAAFFFADHQREGEAQTRFRQCDYRPDGEALSREDGLYRCDPGAVFRAIVERSPVGTSTVVARRDLIGAKRFPDWLRAAGEDSMFWLELLGARPSSACGVSTEVAYGRGVNVFAHGGWGDAQSLQTTLDEMRSQQMLRTRFPLSADLEARSHAQSRRLDLSFCANLIACTRRLRWDAGSAALSYVSERPLALLRMPEAMMKALQNHDR